MNVKKTRKYSELLWKLDVAGKVKSKHQSYIMKLIDKFPSKCGSFFHSCKCSTEMKYVNIKVLGAMSFEFR